MSRTQVDVIVRRPGHSEQRASFGPGIVHIGRAEDNDLVLTDIGVSRRHARLVIQDGGVFLEDLGSGNGTFFHGDRVLRQAIEHGHEFVIDPFSLCFELADEDPSSVDGLTGELEDVGDDDTAEIPVDVGGQSAPAISADAQVRLVTLQGQRLAPSYQVRKEGLSIGRSEARDVILFDPAASRNHAALEMINGDVWFRDLGSGNGSFVNGHRVREQCLRSGDRVRIGSTEFRFEIVEAVRREPPTLPPSPGLRRRVDEFPVPPVRAVEPQARTGPGRSVPLPPPPPAQGPRLVAMAAAGGFAIVLMAIMGGLMALYWFGPDGRQAGGDAGLASAVEVPAEHAEALAAHIEAGKEFFDQGDFLPAASQFYTALRLVPDHPESERLGAVSCEYLVLDELNKGIVLRSLPEEEQQARRSAAIRTARSAVRGRSDAAAARAVLREVLVFLPEDQRVTGLLEQLKGK